MSKPFDATLKDMAGVNPAEFLAEVDAPPALPAEAPEAPGQFTVVHPSSPLPAKCAPSRRQSAAREDSARRC
jgi:hypothetical protein